MPKQNPYKLFLIYILLVVFTYLTFKFLITNIILISLVLPLFVLVIISALKPPSGSGHPLDKKSLRYTMHCKSCNWEWMSNVGDKAPNTCPNCKEKDKLEILGWRQVLTKEKKSNLDLRKYFK